TLIMMPLAILIGTVGPGIAFTLGFLLSYVGYEVLHRRVHTHPPVGPYGRWARKHHFYHHFSRPNLNHGVTSPIWDVVFGTLETPEMVRVPAKKAMSWLLDPETGDVAEAYAADYVLVRRGDKRRAREARDRRKSTASQEASASA
ncbi:MAG: sterol desaturase family protein, partial [Myxococcota bacterium]